MDTCGLNNSSNVDRRVDRCALADLPVGNIILYLDKAEVTRLVKYDISQGQILECTFEQLPLCIEKDSIRVEVSNNTVTIQDVTINERQVSESSELHRIRELIRTETHNQELLRAKKSRISKQRTVLDKFANNLIDIQSNIDGHSNGYVGVPDDAKKERSIHEAFNPIHLDTIGHFFQLYNDNGESFDESLLNIEEKLKESITKIEFLENEKNEIEMKQDELLYRELTVIIEGQIDGDFELHISYVVNKCSWRPKYDVRVSNATGIMQINYYGIVKQRCGEDWYEPSTFSLSTAQPGTGGTVPEIGLQRVQFKTSLSAPQEVYSPTPATPIQSTPSLKKSTPRNPSFRKSRTPLVNVFDFSATNGVACHSSTPEPRKTSSLDNESGGSGHNNHRHHHLPPEKNNSLRQFSSMGTSFEIARPPSIVLCDNTEYRVMISTISLEPHYQHVTVPKYSPHAYLRSFVTNSSKYTLLEGPVNIYMDSGFIGRTQLPTICPCEEFYCNLGVDKGIKVNYKPMFKYRENAQKSMCVTFKQEIQVINNHERPITIVVVDQLPISGDEKIKVTLIEPTIKNLEKYDKQKPIRINSNRQIEWDCEIGSKDKKDLVLKFSVEHPFGRDIEVMQIK